jgi:hypothetical protein
MVNRGRPTATAATTARAEIPDQIAAARGQRSRRPPTRRGDEPRVRVTVCGVGPLEVNVVGRLRRKLDAGGRPPLLHTVRSVGVVP